jgi:hypothetical protein
MLNGVKHLAAAASQIHVMLNGVKHLIEDQRTSERASLRYFTSFNMTMILGETVIAGISWNAMANLIEGMQIRSI